MCGGLFNDLAVEFDHGFAENRENGGAALGQVIVAAAPLACAHSFFGPKPAVTFQPLEQRIERAWADVVPMPAQFTEHPLADDRMLCRMVKDVHLPKAQQNLTGQQFGIKRGHSKQADLYYDSRKRMM
jgi:hypothetical protein